MSRSLLQLRNSILLPEIKKELKRFFDGEKSRRCASCGRVFSAKQRHHHFDGKDCRRDFYRGQFAPRKPSD